MILHYTTGIINRYITPYLGGIKLVDFNANHARKLFVEMEEKGRSSKTIGYTHTLLKSILQQAVDDDIILKNPITKIKRPKQIKTKEMVTLTNEQVKSYLDVITNKEHYALFKLAFTSAFVGLNY